MGGIRTMTSAGAVTAWRFLRRNPRYIQERRTAVARSPCAEGEPLPMRKQTRWTGKPRRVACSHGRTPLAEDGPSSPFWVDLPTLEGESG